MVQNLTNSAQPTRDGGGTQPNEQPKAANGIAVVAPGANPSLPPQNPTKKQKPNASGKRKTSAAWDHFNILLENEL